MRGIPWQDLVDRQEGFINFTPELHAVLPEVRVAVIGAGGNGAVLDLLARAGFARFAIIDPDLVEGTNLNRLPFGRDAIGRPKAAVWKEYLRNIHPGCEVAAFERSISRHDGPWLREVLSETALVFLGTSDVEANLVTGRTASELGIRMVIGPASSGSCIVSTFTHDNGLDVETLGRFGTTGTPLQDIDYKALRPLYAKAMAFPGRQGNVTPETWKGLQSGDLPARSCGIFVRLTNAAMALEGIKNAAALRGLSLERTRVVAMPEVQVFDPWSGCAYRYNVQTGAIGIPVWPGGEVHWLEPVSSVGQESDA